MSEKMSTFKVLVLAAIFFIQVIMSVDNRKASSACQPYEEGSDVSFQCTDSNRSRDLYWHHNDARVATCLHNSTKCSSNYHVVRVNGTSIISLIGISRKDPSKEGRWRCGYDSPDEDLYHCDLIIYHAPENLDCKPPVLTQVEKQHVVVVNCSAFNVFPTANCTFFRRISLNNDVELQTSSYRQENAQDDPIYFNFFCGLTYPIKDDLVGNLTFFLQMSMDVNKTYDSNQTIIHIDAPKATLLDGCFSKREDNVFWPTDTIHCKCEMRDIDNGTIRVVWIDADQRKINYNPTIVIHYDDDKDTTFICEGTSRSGKVYNITYIPNFADAAKVTLFTANGERDINVENATVVEFNCEVDSKPRGTVYITDSSGQRLDSTSKLLTCDDTGIYTCQAFNEIFANDISRQYVHVTVKCNPWLELFTTGSKIQRVYADKNENVSIDFELSMGYTQIKKYKMYKDGKNMPTVMYADKDENAEYGRYRIQFQSLSETHYKITLNIFNIESLDFGIYTLKIYDDNGDVVEGSVEIKGNISEEDLNLSLFGSTVGLSIALLFCLGIICLICRTGSSSAGVRAQNNNMTNYATNNTTDNATNNTTNNTSDNTINNTTDNTTNNTTDNTTRNTTVNTSNNTIHTARTNTSKREDTHTSGDSFNTANEIIGLLANSLEPFSVNQERQPTDETHVKSPSSGVRVPPVGDDSSTSQSNNFAFQSIQDNERSNTCQEVQGYASLNPGSNV